MPTYEYLCQTCSHRFETWQKMTDDPLTVCPECGNHIRRVLYPAGVVFKGSGFYSTDHANRKSNENEHKDEHHGEHGEHAEHSEHSEHKEGDGAKPAANGEKKASVEGKNNESKAAQPSAGGTSKPASKNNPAMPTSSSAK